jgi:HK97 family phage prohead protease
MFTKDFKLEIKSVGGDTDFGTFSGYVSVYNVTDFYGEVVEPGAFDETLQEHSGIFPLLWQHDCTEPIGTFSAVSDEHGLAVDARLCLGTVRGREAYELIKMNKSPIQGMSIGYNTRKDDFRKDGTRMLQVLDLWEGSLTTFPANKEAVINEVRSIMDLGQAVKMIASADPKELAKLEPNSVRQARSILGRILKEDDDVDRITEFVANEVLEWMTR